MTVDPTTLDASATTVALLAAFLATFLEMIRRHLKKSEALDERRVVADERQAVSTGELVTEIRRLIDRVGSLEDQFQLHGMTPPLGTEVTRPATPSAVAASGSAAAGRQGPGSPGLHGPTPKRSVTSG